MCSVRNVQTHEWNSGKQKRISVQKKKRMFHLLMYKLYIDRQSTATLLKYIYIYCKMSDNEMHTKALWLPLGMESDLHHENEDLSIFNVKNDFNYFLGYSRESCPLEGVTITWTSIQKILFENLRCPQEYKCCQRYHLAWLHILSWISRIKPRISPALLFFF